MSDENFGGSAESLDQDPIETEEIVEEVLTPVEKKRINSLKLKYNGREIEEKLPFDIDDNPEAIEYMTRQLQLAKMSQSKAQESANLEREVVAFMQELKTNPRKALSNPMIGLDIKQLAADILEEEIANSQKSPEQLKIEKYEARLKEIEDERQQEKDASERRSYEQTLERSYEKYENMMLGALESNPDLPSTPYIVDKMTKYMSIAVEEGYEPDMEIIANIVREEVNGDVKHLLNILPADKVEQLLGKDVLDKLRKNRLAGIKKAPPVTIKTLGKDVANKRPESKVSASSKQTMRDFFGI
jgi:hypothetical protein